LNVTSTAHVVPLEQRAEIQAINTDSIDHCMKAKRCQIKNTTVAAQDNASDHQQTTYSEKKNVR